MSAAPATPPPLSEPALPRTGKPRSDLRIVTHQADAIRRHRLALQLPAPYS
ncbi:MAG: hypothetical protein LAO06_18715 [Acidobacteriia bacterium]|nr:hypothetical protein [Terriglobia bacterium]